MLAVGNAQILVTVIRVVGKSISESVSDYILGRLFICLLAFNWRGENL